MREQIVSERLENNGRAKETFAPLIRRARTETCHGHVNAITLEAVP